MPDGAPNAPTPRPPRPRTPVSIAILGLNAAVFIGQLALPGQAGDVDEVARRLGLWAPSVWEGEAWRLVTAAFVHFGALHIFFNMFVLWDIGRLCEVVVRPARYAILYVASAVGGTVASTLFTRGLSGGASGALFGVAGALLALVLLDRERRVFVQRDRLKGLLLRFLAINMAVQFVIPHIDVAAHVGGCVTGAAVGAYLFGRSPLSGQRGAPIRKTALVALVLIVLATVYSLHPVGLPRFEEWRSSPARLIDSLLGS